jgi:hypothetical protein
MVLKLTISERQADTDFRDPWKRRQGRETYPMKQLRDPEIVSASEIASWVWCPEAWRLGAELGLRPNMAGTRRMMVYRPTS